MNQTLPLILTRCRLFDPVADIRLLLGRDAIRAIIRGGRVARDTMSAASASGTSGVATNQE